MSDYKKQILKKVKELCSHLPRGQRDVVAFSCQNYVKCIKNAPKKLSNLLEFMKSTDPTYDPKDIVGKLQQWRKQFHNDSKEKFSKLVETAVHGTMTEELYDGLEDSLEDNELFCNRNIYPGTTFADVGNRDTNFFNQMHYWNLDFHEQTKADEVFRDNTEEQVH